MITYRAINTSNGKFYIGSTNDLDRRKKEHLKSKGNYPFQNALRNNPDLFEWEFVEDECEEPVLEQAMLDMWYGKEQCYNLSQSASHPPRSLGKIWWTHLDSGVECQSENLPGPEWRQGRNNTSMEASHKANTGITLNKETIEKIRKGRTGKKHSEQTKQKISDSREGQLWWVNADGETCREKECPGVGWQSGRVWKTEFT
jgi:group I intron endonuclease